MSKSITADNSADNFMSDLIKLLTTINQFSNLTTIFA